MTAFDASRSGYASLRRFRASIPDGHYFLTIRSGGSSTSLTTTAVFDACRVEAQRLTEEDRLYLRALVLMPDHLHALVQLGGAGSLGDAVRLWKGRMTPALRRAGGAWQKGAYYEHRLRPDEPVAGILRYMLANPYRKNLLPITKPWPWWYCDRDTSSWFTPTTDEGRPHVEWIQTDAPPVKG